MRNGRDCYYCITAQPRIMGSSYESQEGQAPLVPDNMATAGEAQGRGSSAQLSAESWAPSQLPRGPRLGMLFLTLPGTGLLHQALLLGFIGHLDEPVLTALGQHLLHGGCRQRGEGCAEEG